MEQNTTLEQVTEVTEKMDNANGIKTIAVLGVTGTLGIAAWEFLIKPCYRKVKDVVTKRLEETETESETKDDPKPQSVKGKDK